MYVQQQSTKLWPRLLVTEAKYFDNEYASNNGLNYTGKQDWRWRYVDIPTVISRPTCYTEHTSRKRVIKLAFHQQIRN